MEQLKIKQRTEDEKKQIINRLHRVNGQIKGIENMILEDRYCDDVLIQLAAADKSLKAIFNIVLESHVKTCLVENVKNDNLEILDDIISLIKRLQ